MKGFSHGFIAHPAFLIADKYHAPANTPLGELVDFIQLQSGLSIKKPIFVFFKNTITQTGELLLN